MKENLSVIGKRSAWTDGKQRRGTYDKRSGKVREKCGWNELAEGKKKSVLSDFFWSSTRISW